MRLKELAKEVSKETKYPAYEIEELLKVIIVVMVRCIIRGQVVILNNFLSIKTDVVPERKVHDIKTNKTISLPRRFKLKITFAKKLKDEVNAKKAY